MKWSDKGIVLSTRKYGESSLILSLMTSDHGRHLGHVRGGNSKRQRGKYEVGNYLSVTWNSRVEDQLGNFSCELLKSHAVLHFQDPLRLAGLSAACSTLERALPERESYFELYKSLFNFLSALESDDWLEKYVHWEISILRCLGFGLNLAACAATGKKSDLIYVSPKSGKAVSKIAGEPYKNKLLALPSFLNANQTRINHISYGEIIEGLTLTSYFLNQYVFVHNKHGCPPARDRLVDRVKQKHNINNIAVTRS